MTSLLIVDNSSPSPDHYLFGIKKYGYRGYRMVAECKLIKDCTSQM